MIPWNELRCYLMLRCSVATIFYFSISFRKVALCINLIRILHAPNGVLSSYEVEWTACGHDCLQAVACAIPMKEGPCPWPKPRKPRGNQT